MWPGQIGMNPDCCGIGPANACLSRSAGSSLCRTAGSRAARTGLCTTGSCAGGPAGTATQSRPERTSAKEQTPADASHAAGLERISGGGADPAVGLRS